METLRDTVERLEAKYVRALKEKEALAADSPDAQRALRFPYLTSYTQSSAATLGNFASGASAKYSELISTTSRLKEENFRLKQTIHEKHKLKQTLERFFSDYVETAPASPAALVRHICIYLFVYFHISFFIYSAYEAYLTILLFVYCVLLFIVKLTARSSPRNYHG